MACKCRCASLTRRANSRSPSPSRAPSAAPETTAPLSPRHARLRTLLHLLEINSDLGELEEPPKTRSAIAGSAASHDGAPGSSQGPRVARPRRILTEVMTSSLRLLETDGVRRKRLLQAWLRDVGENGADLLAEMEAEEEGEEGEEGGEEDGGDGGSLLAPLDPRWSRFVKRAVAQRRDEPCDSSSGEEEEEEEEEEEDVVGSKTTRVANAMAPVRGGRVPSPFWEVAANGVLLLTRRGMPAGSIARLGAWVLSEMKGIFR